MKKKVQTVKKKARRTYTQLPTMRISESNLNALKKLKDCLEIRHEKDMEELDILNLSVDDALNYVLIRYARTHPELAEELDIDSRITKIMQYSGVD